MDTNIYDYIVVGGGPSGLALAQCLSDLNLKIAIIEREDSLGGCHRVRRVSDGAFTEHGPRIYSNSYKTFDHLLKNMKLNFYDLFTPYKFNLSEIGGETMWTTLTFRELFLFFLNFTFLVLDSNHGKTTFIKTFMELNNFKSKSIEMIDRLCRLTDGATMEKYTLNKFLQLFNQQVFYGLYQPKLPNDIGLFKYWKAFLESKGVEFFLNAPVQTIIKGGKYFQVNGMQSKNVILAIPPVNTVELLRNSDYLIQNSFGAYTQLLKFSEDTRYIDYISFTFHWDKHLELEKVYGFPKSEWGIAFIVMTDYMKFEEPFSKTVMSLAITIPEKKSSRINKTANECTEDEIYNESLFQLKKAFPTLETPRKMIMSPGVIRQQDKWISLDTAFINTMNKSLNAQSSIKGLYTVGTHNGNSKYEFTALESAVQNAVQLAHDLYPELQTTFPLKHSLQFSKVVLIIILLSVVYYIVFKNGMSK